MILQGIFNIFSLYLEDVDLFYNATESYFRDLIANNIQTKFDVKEDIETQLVKLSQLIKAEFINLGFDPEEIENQFSDPFLDLKEEDSSSIFSIYDLYSQKFGPLVNEIFMEKFVNYIINPNITDLMLSWKSKGFLPIEFIMELTNLKNLYSKYPNKEENLRKYLLIKKKIVEKLNINKERIEDFELINKPKEKLQLTYLIYRIISFFNLVKSFDYSPIKDYLSANEEEWLLTIPLVTLKNPDLYYCGLFLAQELNIEIDHDKVKNFLLELYEEGIDEFEAPLIEATDGIYYFLKSTHFMKLWLPELKIKPLIETDSKFFEPSYLKRLETSQLVIILKIYNLLRTSKVDRNINMIIEELDTRVSSEGIKQNRDGFITSEATYYVLFCNYMRNSLEKLKENDLLESVISRIYRNLEILEFRGDMNYDLISELIYSLEILKLYNCIETKEMIIKLAEYLFPPEIIEKISKERESFTRKAKFRHFKVDRTTGETIR
jgi:hypothetical protein